MPKCGHINKHSHGVKGKPDNLKCTLEKGHSGDHSADHFERGTQLSNALTPDERIAFKRVAACPTCKGLRDFGDYCPECFSTFPENAKVLWEGTVNRSWNDAAGVEASKIVPASPGEEVIQSDHMFPELQKQKDAERDARIAVLEQKLAEAVSPEKEVKK